MILRGILFIALCFGADTCFSLVLEEKSIDAYTKKDLLWLEALTGGSIKISKTPIDNSRFRYLIQITKNLSEGFHKKVAVKAAVCISERQVSMMSGFLTRNFFMVLEEDASLHLFFDIYESEQGVDPGQYEVVIGGGNPSQISAKPSSPSSNGYCFEGKPGSE